MVDPTYGTAIIDRDTHATRPLPIMWRVGFTARAVGSEVEVRDPAGNVVATTGHDYRIDGGGVSIKQADGSVLETFWACNRVQLE